MGDMVMSKKERRRLEVLSRVRDGDITQKKAATLLRLCYRHTKRIYRRYHREGDKGLVHRSRGRPSNRGIDREVRDAILGLYASRYTGFGPTLACEHLARSDGYTISRETLRQWLLKEGKWEKRRRRKKHRRWRERRAHRGELVQMDGSHHDWFEGRRGKAVLMVMVDDASSLTYARFFEGETTRAAMETFQKYAEQYGLPHALYVDRDCIYRCDRQATVEEELRGSGPLTQFGRAMETLGVRLTLAFSAPAKGRVERTNGTLQDRLIKEMRLRGIETIEDANMFLEEEFLPAYNKRFTVVPRKETDLHRTIPKRLKLDEVLCFEERRVVQNDWTLRWRNRFFQIDTPTRSAAWRLVRQKVIVREKLDGEIQLVFKGRMLPFHEIPRHLRQPARWNTTVDAPWRGLASKQRHIA